MRKRFKKSKEESKKLSIEDHNKSYVERMKELMPEQFVEQPQSLEEKIDKEIANAQKELSDPSVNQLRPYYLGRRRALEWVKRELKKELDDIRGTTQKINKTVKADIEGKQQRIDELSNLKDQGLVSLKGDLMKELRRRTELMEVITEIPKDETTESKKDDSQDKQP